MSLLSLQNIGFEVSSRQILRDVSFEVAPGEVLALLGPNGAGKSTLLSIIAGDVKASSGQILIEDAPLSSYSPLQLARHRSMLLQKIAVAFSYSVEEVVAMGRAPWRGTEHAKNDELMIAQSMERTDSAHLAERDITTLSGGEAGRAHLARVFAQNTPLVLLDEPTAALDITHQEKTLASCRQLANQGYGVVVVLHDLDTAAAYADRMILLDQGQVVAAGTPAEVCEEELLSRVYQHPIEVLQHPVTQRLLILPKR